MDEPPGECVIDAQRGRIIGEAAAIVNAADRVASLWELFASHTLALSPSTSSGRDARIGIRKGLDATHFYYLSSWLRSKTVPKPAAFLF